MPGSRESQYTKAVRQVRKLNALYGIPASPEVDRASHSTRQATEGVKLRHGNKFCGRGGNKNLNVKRFEVR